MRNGWIPCNKGFNFDALNRLLFAQLSLSATSKCFFSPVPVPYFISLKYRNNPKKYENMESVYSITVTTIGWYFMMYRY